MVQLPWHGIEDLDYKKLELVNDIREFFPTLVKIVQELNQRGLILLQWRTSLESIFNVILTAQGHPQSVDDPLPRGGISLKPEEWKERHLAEANFDSLMVALCKYFGVKKEDLITENFFKRKPCTRSEFLLIKSIHKRLSLLIDHQSKKTEAAYSKKQGKLYEDIKDAFPRLNQISQLLNVPLEIGLNNFKLVILGSNCLSKEEARIICSKALYQGRDLTSSDVLATEVESLRLIAKENIDNMMRGLCKYFKQTKQSADIAEAELKAEGSKLMATAGTSKENWEAIKKEYDISKKEFGKKINFVKDSFKRKIIFRDTEHAFALASQGFSKPALILAGGVIEELLRQYLEHKKVKPERDTFFAYIKACKKDLLKHGVYSLSDAIRDFRNYVHLVKEKTKSDTILKTTAKGAVSSIFTIANDFE